MSTEIPPPISTSKVNFTSGFVLEVNSNIVAKPSSSTTTTAENNNSSAKPGEKSHAQFLQDMAKGHLHHRSKGILAQAGTHTEIEYMKIRSAEEERQRKLLAEADRRKEAEGNAAELQNRKAVLEAERAKKAAKRKNKNKKKGKKDGNGSGAGKNEGGGALNGENDGEDDDDDEEENE